MQAKRNYPLVAISPWFCVCVCVQSNAIIAATASIRSRLLSLVAKRVKGETEKEFIHFFPRQKASWKALQAFRPIKTFASSFGFERSCVLSDSQTSQQSSIYQANKQAALRAFYLHCR